MVLLFFYFIIHKISICVRGRKKKDASETRDIRSDASFFDKRALN